MAPEFTRRDFLAGLMLPAVSGWITDDSARIRRWLEAIYNTDSSQPSPFSPKPESWDSNSLTATWIGHSTVLMNMFGTTILTDPVFSERVGLNMGGVFTLGPKRLVAPAMAIEALPLVHLVLVSHGHMDHCDVETLKELPRTTRLIMPENTLSILDGLDFQAATELRWGDKTYFKGLTIEALPVRHKGSRYPWVPSEDEIGPASNAYLISSGDTNVVFAGDTAYHRGFRELSRKQINVDLAILPIGGYVPHHDNHCTPEEALLMADDMLAHHILPVHWGTFPGEEGMDEPIERLQKASSANPERIVIQQIGQTWKMEE